MATEGRIFLLQRLTILVSGNLTHPDFMKCQNEQLNEDGFIVALLVAGLLVCAVISLIRGVRIDVKLLNMEEGKS